MNDIYCDQNQLCAWKRKKRQALFSQRERHDMI